MCKDIFQDVFALGIISKFSIVFELIKIFLDFSETFDTLFLKKYRQNILLLVSIHCQYTNELHKEYMLHIFNFGMIFKYL